MSVTGRSTDSAARRRLRRSVIGFSAAVVVALALLQTISLWSRHRETVTATQARASDLTHILAEHMRSAVAAVDASLKQLVLHNHRVGGPAAPPEAWLPVLRTAIAGMSHVGSLTVTDADGVIRSSTIPALIGQSRREQFLFTRLAADPNAGVVADTPFRSLTEHRIIIPLGRRLAAADGTFQGIVVATLIPEAFRDFYKSVDVGRGGVIEVIHPTGLVFFREPSAGDPNGDQADAPPLFNTAVGRGEAGVLTAPLEQGGPTFVSAWRGLDEPPITLAVSFNLHEMMSTWRRDALLSVGLTLLVALALGAASLQIVRQLDARSAAERALVQRDQALQAALREVEEASRLKDEFLAIVSHELRTPLTSIVGWIGLLRMGRMDEVNAARALETIERNAKEEARIVNDLLDISNIIRGNLRLDVRAVALTPIIEAAIDVLRPAAEAKSIQFKIDLDRAAGPVLGDPSRLQQVMWNLLSNAVKFTPDRGQVQVRLRRVDSHIEISVQDTGQGINPEFLPYVFERFRQADGSYTRKLGGLGLGLAIVRHLVELHGGRVHAESPGERRGATFIVELPLLPALTEGGDSAINGSQVEAGVDGDRIQALAGLRCLVVEDDPDAQEMIAAVLTASGARVRSVSSFEEALEAFKRWRPQVLVSDIGLPGRDGYELIKAVRALAPDEGSRVHAVALTAYAREEDREKAFAAGYQQHVAKPVEPDKLVEVIVNVVGQSDGSA